MNQIPRYVPQRTVKLTGRERPPLTDEQRKLIFFWLRRHTSVTYLRRAAQLFRTFTEGYERVVAAGRGRSNEWDRETLRQCYWCLGRLEPGIELLEKGHKTAGYSSVLEGLDFGLRGRRYELGDLWVPVGYRYPPPSVGLFAWAERASNLSFMATTTIRHDWCYEEFFLDQAFVDHLFVPPSTALLPPLPELDRRAPVIRPGEEVTETGIWQPLDVTGALPNFLVQGWGVPEVTRADREIRSEAMLDADPPILASTDWMYETEATRWQLLWKDPRYLDGASAVEPEFLGSDLDDPPSSSVE